MSDDSDFFLLTNSPEFRECFRYLEHVFHMLFHNSTALWSESFTEKTSKIRLFDVLKNVLKTLFFGFSYFSIDNFTCTCRMTLIFLLTDSPEFRECFRYLEHVFHMLFRNSTALWSESFIEKNVINQSFRPPQKRPQNTFFWDFHTFLSIISLVRVGWL